MYVKMRLPDITSNSFWIVQEQLSKNLEEWGHENMYHKVVHGLFTECEFVVRINDSKTSDRVSNNQHHDDDNKIDHVSQLKWQKMKTKWEAELQDSTKNLSCIWANKNMYDPGVVSIFKR